jgi:hypothetical protein
VLTKSWKGLKEQFQGRASGIMLRILLEPDYLSSHQPKRTPESHPVTTEFKKAVPQQ